MAESFNEPVSETFYGDVSRTMPYQELAIAKAIQTSLRKMDDRGDRAMEWEGDETGADG